ncbi:DUF1566 domain-containing protein [Thermodesulfobacteriota bacterium]
MVRKFWLLAIVLSVSVLFFGCASRTPTRKIAIQKRLQKLASGVVLDTQTGLEWIAGPDRNTSWNEARLWVGNLTLAGVGWRMPTRKELKTLYLKGSGSRNMTPLLETTGWWVWSGETRSPSSSWYVDFRHGSELWFIHSFNNFGRGFAVRSRR